MMGQVMSSNEVTAPELVTPTKEDAMPATEVPSVSEGTVTCSKNNSFDSADYFAELWERIGLYKNNKIAATHMPTSEMSMNEHDDSASSILPHILGDAYALVQQEQEVAERRFAALLEDIQQVLTLSNGAGLRVLRHWLDAACSFDRVFDSSVNIYAQAALTDFARQRMAEIALADPASYLSLQLVAAQMAGKSLIPS